MYKIVVADDEPLIIRGLKKLVDCRSEIARKSSERPRMAETDGTDRGRASGHYHSDIAMPPGDREAM